MTRQIIEPSLSLRLARMEDPLPDGRWAAIADPQGNRVHVADVRTRRVVAWFTEWYQRLSEAITSLHSPVR